MHKTGKYGVGGPVDLCIVRVAQGLQTEIRIALIGFDVIA